MIKLSFLTQVAVLSILVGCFQPNPKGWGPWYKPRYFHMKGAPQYDPKTNDYQKGFLDGCQNHGSIMGAGMHRSLPTVYNGWKMTGYDSSIKNLDLYQIGVGDGEEHCTYSNEWDTT